MTMAMRNQSVDGRSTMRERLAALLAEDLCPGRTDCIVVISLRPFSLTYCSILFTN
jgi:hypothetical protein